MTQVQDTTESTDVAVAEPTGTPATTEERQARLAELKAVIATGLETFEVVGTALEEVRRDKLFIDAGYQTFGAFAKAEFGISSGRAYQLVQEQKLSNALESARRAANVTEPERRTSGRAMRAALDVTEGDVERAADLIITVEAAQPATEQAVRDAAPEKPVRVRRGAVAFTPPAETMAERAIRTACVTCAHFEQRHVTRPDGSVGVCRECDCKAYVAPGSTVPTPDVSGPEPVSGDLPVSEPVPDTRFLRLVTDLMLDLNRPETQAGIIALGHNQQVGLKAAEQVLALRNRLDEVADALTGAYGQAPEPVYFDDSEGLLEPKPVGVE